MFEGFSIVFRSIWEHNLRLRAFFYILTRCGHRFFTQQNGRLAGDGLAFEQKCPERFWMVWHPSRSGRSDFGWFRDGSCLLGARPPGCPPAHAPAPIRPSARPSTHACASRPPAGPQARLLVRSPAHPPACSPAGASACPLVREDLF